MKLPPKKEPVVIRLQQIRKKYPFHGFEGDMTKDCPSYKFENVNNYYFSFF